MIEWLIQQQWPLSIAILAVVSCNYLLANTLSAKFRYYLWLLVPAVVIINNLPVSHTMTFDTEIHRYVVSVSQESSAWDIYGIVSGIWVLGLGLIVFIVIHEHLGISQKFSYSKRYSHSIKQSLPVYQSEAVQSPVLFGVLKQVLFVPSNFNQLFNTNQQRLIFEHEWVHFKRRDNWSNALAILVLTIFWFNPLCWLAYSHFRKQQEVACDAEVLTNATTTERIEYCRTLLACISENHNKLTSYSYYMEKKTMKQRLNQIQTMPKGNALANLLIALILLSGLSSVAFAKYGEGHSKDKTAQVKPIVRIEPVYPKAAVEQKLEGSVVLGFTLTQDGSTSNIRVISAEPKGVFDREAKRALKKWKYTPPKNTERQHLVQLDFALSEDYQSKDLIERIQVKSH